MPCALFFCWISLLSTVLVSASLRNVFTGAHSSLSAHGFPWCLRSVGQDLMLWRPVLHRKIGILRNLWQLTILKGHFSLSKPAAHMVVWRCSTTNSIKQKCRCEWSGRRVYASAHARLCVCVFAIPARWGPPLTRAIKVYKREAQLSVKLTGCPHPTLHWGEPQETLENPWPCFDRELRCYGWVGLGWDWLKLWWDVGGCSLKVGKEQFEGKINGSPQTVWEILRW